MNSRSSALPLRFASRLGGVGISMIRQIMLKAQGCINLGIGEPDFFAPSIIREEAHRVLDEEKIGYSPTAGIPELCDQVRRYHGGHPDHAACITNGSQEAMFDVTFALISEGDEVLVPNPGFVAFPTVTRLAGGTPVPYPLRRHNRFQLVPEDILPLVTPRTRAIFLNSPSNPTGQSHDREQLAAVARVAEENNMVILSDEIYREIYYTERRPPSVLDVTDRAVVLSGVSKMATMTGWRVGWAYGPREIIEKVTVMHQYTSSCASTLSQKAALRAFGSAGREATEQQRKMLAQTCDFLCSWIEQELGRPYVRPQGAIYLLLSVADLQRSSFETCMELLNDRVATIPGSAFGPESEGFLRISFACDRAVLQSGLNRLKSGLARLSREKTVSG